MAYGWGWGRACVCVGDDCVSYVCGMTVPGVCSLYHFSAQVKRVAHRATTQPKLQEAVFTLSPALSPPAAAENLLKLGEPSLP